MDKQYVVCPYSGMLLNSERNEDPPGGAVFKNLPAKKKKKKNPPAGDTGLTPSRGRFHKLRVNYGDLVLQPLKAQHPRAPA